MEGRRRWKNEARRNKIKGRLKMKAYEGRGYEGDLIISQNDSIN